MLGHGCWPGSASSCPRPTAAQLRTLKHSLSSHHRALRRRGQCQPSACPPTQEQSCFPEGSPVWNHLGIQHCYPRPGDLQCSQHPGGCCARPCMEDCPPSCPRTSVSGLRGRWRWATEEVGVAQSLARKGSIPRRVCSPSEASSLHLGQECCEAGWRVKRDAPGPGPQSPQSPAMLLLLF